MIEEDEVEIYESETLSLIMKHLTVELKEGIEINFPFHLENFCMDMDFKLKRARRKIDAEKDNLLQ